MVAGTIFFAGMSNAVSAQGSGQPDNKYGLKTIATMEEYRTLVAQDPRQELVELVKMIPDITLDIRYATDNNIRVYSADA